MYVTPKKASEFYSVTHSTLTRWAREGKIRHIKTKGDQFRYWINPENAPTTQDHPTNHRIVVVYGRVSSTKQKEDLNRQIGYLTEKYPDSEVITDIGSGLNFNRKPLQSLLEKIVMGTVSTVVISHKDRISRFGFEWFEFICKSHDTKLLVINDKNNSFKSPRDELVEDLLAVTHSFSSKMYSNRKYTGNKDNLQTPEDQTKTK